MAIALDFLYKLFLVRRLRFRTFVWRARFFIGLERAAVDARLAAVDARVNIFVDFLKKCRTKFINTISVVIYILLLMNCLFYFNVIVKSKEHNNLLR